MAVYTEVLEQDLHQFLSQYNLGELTSHQGIEKGVSNTNYHVFTTTGRYILTLFEPRRVNHNDLPFFFQYAHHLIKKQVLCPPPIADRKGQRIGTLNDRAAAILPFLPGEDITTSDITPTHCAKLGDFLAQMHNATTDFKPQRKNSMAIDTWIRITNDILPKLDTYQHGLKSIVQNELNHLKTAWPQDTSIPRGAVHADMFPDNIFWVDNTIQAMIDYYFACTEFYAYDLALTINAWCFDHKNRWSTDRYAALIKAYENIRPLSTQEREALRTLCRGAAFRILITRLEEYISYDPTTTLMKPHDPQEYLLKLQHHQNANDTL